MSFHEAILFLKETNDSDYNCHPTGPTLHKTRLMCLRNIRHKLFVSSHTGLYSTDTCWEETREAASVRGEHQGVRNTAEDERTLEKKYFY